MAKRSKRRAWTPLDVRKLKAAAKRKTRAASIARALRRTEGAVIRRRPEKRRHRIAASPRANQDLTWISRTDSLSTVS